MARLFSFPHPVNETSARLVATGAVSMSVLFAVTGWGWVLIPLTYGFVARVLAGPRFSPLGRLVTQVITPRIHRDHALVAGPPKRFAQGIGAVFSVTASILFALGHVDAARVVIVALAGAASLEAFVGFCLGCWIFARLMSVGLIPESVCEECNNITARLTAAR